MACGENSAIWAQRHITSDLRFGALGPLVPQMGEGHSVCVRGAQRAPNRAKIAQPHLSTGLL